MQSLVANTWYAVQRSIALGKRPTTVERLGRSFVLWRTKDGVHAAPSQCPHRGADLGTGKVIDGCLTCPYHGIRFDADGAAVHRPAVGKHDHIPTGAGLRTIPTVEAHGYIWIWHGTNHPTSGPEWFDDEQPTATVGADQIWNVHYSRFMESALDFHHVPFVHGTYTPGIGHVLTDVAAFRLVEHMLAGGPPGEAFRLGLADGAFDVSTQGDGLSTEMTSTLEAIRSDIAEGLIDVPTALD